MVVHTGNPAAQSNLNQGKDNTRDKIEGCCSRILLIGPWPDLVCVSVCRCCVDSAQLDTIAGTACASATHN